MAESNWTEEAPSAPKKSRIPTWAWFCGGGCLLALIVGAVLAIVGVSFFKKALDPKQQWANLAKVLPYDEQPEDVQLVWGNQLGVEQYVLHDKRHDFQVTLQRIEGKRGGEARGRMFSAEHPQFPQDAGVMRFEDLTFEHVDVQGRELGILRMRMELSGLMKRFMPEEAQNQLGAAAYVDLTPEGKDELFYAQIMRTHGGDAISNDEIRDFLKPFHVGPKR